MCFSATASFAAGGSLSAVGVATLRKTRAPAEVPFAAVPLFFGIQQTAEGLVWLSLGSGNAALNTIASHAFYIFATIGWPVFLPIAIFLIEPVRWRRKALLALEALGVVVGAYFAYFMATIPVTSKITGLHIIYAHPSFYIYEVLAAYIVVTCGSCLLSSRRIINLFGILALLSFAIAHLFYYVALVSVWCFFAAVLSIVVYLYFR